MGRSRPQKLTVAITELDDEGRGVGVHDAVTMHVAGALPDERVVVELEHKSPHKPEAWARLVMIESSSVARRPPSCPATGRCGGCPLGTLAYESQLAWKQSRLVRAISTLPGAPKPLPIVAAPRPLGYRNHARLVYSTDKERPRLGGYAPNSHDVVDLAGCRVVEPVIEEVRAALLAGFIARGVAAYDEKTKQGLVSYVALRANHAGRVHATLIGPDLDALAELATLHDVHPALIGLSVNQRPQGNAIFGKVTRTIAGAGELDEQVGAVRLHLSPTAFFQVNRDIAARIYEDVVAHVPANGRIVDAYAGVGGIALALAHAGAKDVVGIEVNAASVHDATRAASALPTPPRFIADDAAAGLDKLRAEAPIESLVVNPPRRGLDATMLKAIAAATPQKLAYVSCDPDSLVRDLAALSAQGLALSRVQAYDMHPQTPHIETLAILQRYSR